MHLGQNFNYKILSTDVNRLPSCVLGVHSISHNIVRGARKRTTELPAGPHQPVRDGPLPSSLYPPSQHAIHYP